MSLTGEITVLIVGILRRVLYTLLRIDVEANVATKIRLQRL